MQPEVPTPQHAIFTFEALEDFSQQITTLTQLLNQQNPNPRFALEVDFMVDAQVKLELEPLVPFPTLTVEDLEANPLLLQVRGLSL